MSLAWLQNTCFSNKRDKSISSVNFLIWSLAVFLGWHQYGYRILYSCFLWVYKKEHLCLSSWKSKIRSLWGFMLQYLKPRCTSMFILLRWNICFKSFLKREMQANTFYKTKSAFTHSFCLIWWIPVHLNSSLFSLLQQFPLY